MVRTHLCFRVSAVYQHTRLEPVYRLAEKEWKDFVEVFTDLLVGADPQVPPLPPKDVIHRIYRDVRLSFICLCFTSI